MGGVAFTGPVSRGQRPLWEYWRGQGGMVRVHSRDVCRGPWCVIHRPMPGPWTDWPLHWRSDRGFMERTCPCGVGHPAAEQHEYWASVGTGYMSVHGCCGRCKCGPGGAVKQGNIIEIDADQYTVQSHAVKQIEGWSSNVRD